MIDISKPVAVRFPDAGTTSVPPLKLESDEVQQDTNPVVLWQVRMRNIYCLFPFLLSEIHHQIPSRFTQLEDSSL